MSADNIEQKNILLGNAFSLTLVRRKVSICPITLDELRGELARANVHSFWEHTNTAVAAAEILGLDASKFDSRRPLGLSSNKLPIFDGIEFSECYVLSPNYRESFRPQIAHEVTPEEITSWSILKLEWR